MNWKQVHVFIWHRKWPARPVMILNYKLQLLRFLSLSLCFPLSMRFLSGNLLQLISECSARDLFIRPFQFPYAKCGRVHKHACCMRIVVMACVWDMSVTCTHICTSASAPYCSPSRWTAMVIQSFSKSNKMLNSCVHARAANDNHCCARCLLLSYVQRA